MDLTSFYCWYVNLIFEIPQNLMNFWFNVFGLTAPDLSELLGGSVLGCPI